MENEEMHKLEIRCAQAEQKVSNLNDELTQYKEANRRLYSENSKLKNEAQEFDRKISKSNEQLIIIKTRLLKEIGKNAELQVDLNQANYDLDRDCECYPY